MCDSASVLRANELSSSVGSDRGSLRNVFGGGRGGRGGAGRGGGCRCRHPPLHVVHQVTDREVHVEDVGAHNELLERNAFYQTLYQAQMDERDDGEVSA